MWARIRSGRSFGIVCLSALMALSSLSLAEAGQIRGSVIDREGKPAAGAKVWVANLRSIEPLDVRETTTDGSGAFAIEAGVGVWAVYALRGEEGGRAAWDSIPDVEEGKDPAPVTVRLGPPSKLKGRLLDAETGEPISQGQFVLDDARRLKVDAQGRFEALGLEITNHEAYPVCPGYERRRILFDITGRPDSDLELKLARAGKVVGRVLDGAGKPIPGASVGLNTSGKIPSGSALWERCSEDGRYSYDGRSLGKTGRLSAQAPGYRDQERNDVVVLDPAVATEVDFTLQPAPTPTKGAPAAKRADGPTSRRTVSGTVLGPDGKPIASALVRWDIRGGSNKMFETRTDPQGVFRLEGVPDASNVLSVMAKGLAPSFPQVDGGGDRQVSVELKAGATIRGRVLDDAGSPIGGVHVSPQVANPKPNWAGFIDLDELGVETDRDGRFTLEGMPERATCDLVAEGRSAVRRRVLSTSDESKNEVVMLGGGVVRGRVVTPGGRPVRNFRVQVGIPRDLKPGEPAGGYFAGYEGIGLAFTRDDGEFTITGLTAGNLHRLTVIAEDFGAGEADRVEAQSIGRLKPADTPTIKLGAPHAVRVRVFQKGGKLVDGARVTLIQNEGRGGFQWGISDNSWDDSVTARANAEGWAEFPSLAFGKGTIAVRAKGFSRARLDWIKDEEEFDVFLEPEAQLLGTVLDEAGKPLVGARIMLSWGNGESMNLSVDEKDGRYRAEGLGSGPYKLSVSTNFDPPLSSTSIHLEPGKTLTHDIQVKAPNPANSRIPNSPADPL